MPKVCKIKSDEIGVFNRALTTSSGKFEFDLYYDGKDDYFYVKNEDIQKATGLDRFECAINFNKCKTKEDALVMLEAFFSEVQPREKYLYFDADLPLDLITSRKFTDTGKKLLPHFFNPKRHLGNQRDDISRINLAFGYCLKIKSLISDQEIFFDTKSDFKLHKKNNYSMNQDNRVFIKYTKEREEFLKSMIYAIKKIGADIFDFFNLNDEHLENRIDNQPNLLKLNKNN